jgi:PAS domain S-box-containing protein
MGRAVLLTVLFAGLGWMGNCFHLSLGFSLDFLFGSLFTLPAFLVVGMTGGSCATAVASLYTWRAWNHPYGALVALGEGLWVGYAARRRGAEVLQAATLFWMLLGIPLVLVFYGLALHLGFQPALAAAFKQALNGIVNAFLVGLVVRYAPRLLQGSRPSLTNRVALGALLFDFALLAMLVPALIVVVTFCRNQMAREEKGVAGRLVAEGTFRASRVTEWLDRNFLALSVLADMERSAGLGDSAAASRELEKIHRFFPDFRTLFQGSPQGRSVAFHPLVNPWGLPTIGRDFSDRPYFQRVRDTLKPVISEVFLGARATDVPIITLSVPVVKDGALAGFLSGAMRLDSLHDQLARDRVGDGPFFTILDPGNRVVTSTEPGLGPLDAWATPPGERQEDIGGGVVRRVPPPARVDSPMGRWKASRYHCALPIQGTGWTLVTEISADPLKHRGYSLIIWNFGVLLTFFLGMVVMADVLSRRLSQGATRLASFTRNLPDRIERGENLVWEGSRVAEIQSLADHFRTTAVALGLQIRQMKEAKAAVEAAEAKARTMLQTTQDCVLLVGADGAILEANPGACGLLGYAHDELCGTVFSAVEQDLGPEEFQARLRSMRQSGKMLYEAFHVRRDGTRFPVEVSATWIPEQACMVVFGRDITGRRAAEEERRNLENQLHHLARIESVGRLAGGIAHDMNNVLAAIMSVGNVLRIQGGAGTEQVDLILQACRRGRDLVKGLMEFSRREMLETGTFDLNEIVRKEALLLVSTTLQKIEFRQDLGVDLPRLRGASSALSTAMMNLCVNAVDAMPAGGVLTLRTRRVDEGHVSLEVEDTGIGMAEDVVARALEPFFTTKPVGKGTGLGLSRVFGTVQAHGGSLDIQSRPGEGTRIRILLPVDPCPEAPEVGPAQGPGPGHRSLRILVVDDDPLVRFSCLNLLAGSGHHPMGASGGQEALDRIVRGDEWDLVMLDQNMPVLDGLETLLRLRRLRLDLPVLLVTGFLGPGNRSRLAEIPGVRVLMKPYGIEELEAGIRELGLGG